MKKLLYSLLVSLSTLSAYSQTGTDFWFAPPDVTDLHNAPGGEPIYLLISNQSNNTSTVTISLPANGGFTPIAVVINPGEYHKVDLTPFKSQIETRPTNTICNTGIRVQATQPVSVQYEIANASNADMATLWGTNALGNYFYIPFHKHSPFLNHTFASPHQAFASFDIIATQNNTVVRIYSPLPTDGHAALQQFSITLNAGQTYSASWTGANYDLPFTHPSGSVILSNKPVAVSLKNDSEHNPSGSCYDLQFEQLVPVSQLGLEHILLKGALTNNTGDESAIIMATVNGTDIYVNGTATPAATLFAGEYYRIDMDFITAVGDNSIYIRATNPVYMMHYSGFGCEMGDALVPPISYGTSSINVTRSTAESFFLQLVVRTTNLSDFTITGAGTATITPASFVAVPGTGGQFSAARIQYNTTQFPVDATFTIQNSSGTFHAAVINGGPTTGGRYTYLSPFGSLNALPLRMFSLTGRTQSGGNYLEWIAGEDGERYRYELQLKEGSDWTSIDIKESGTIATRRTYQFTHDISTGGARLYRVAATEISTNKTIYTNIVTLNRGNGGRNTMTIFPNPSRNEVNIRLSGTSGTVTARVYTINGQLLQDMSNTGNSFTIDIKQLPAGIYMLKVQDGEQQWQEKITRL